MSTSSAHLPATPDGLTYVQLLEENRRMKERIQLLEEQKAKHDTNTRDASNEIAATTSSGALSTGATTTTATNSSSSSASSSWSHSLTSSQIVRYSRQLILSEFGGADTQRRLLDSHVVIVGAGGLGAPVALYLAAAGIGRLTIVDGDRIELSNLHRQVIHTEARIGMYKSDSAKLACEALNSDVKVRSITERFTLANAFDLVSTATLLVDASDNVATRYLCNDIAITCGKVLVSGSALRLEGQVSVFGMQGETPCYRCLYPKPPPPETVTNCADGGVLGAVTGIIGSIQALEVIKIVGGLIMKGNDDASYPAPLTSSSINYSPSTAAATHSTCDSRLLIFDGSSCTFRSLKLRARRPDCAVCGTNPTVTRQSMEQGLMDYEIFCGSGMHDKPATASATTSTKLPQVSVEEYSALAKAHNANYSSSTTAAASTSTPLLLDVREPVQYRICALDNAVNVPLRVLKREIPTWLKEMLAQRASTTAAQSITPHPGAVSSASSVSLSTSDNSSAASSSSATSTAPHRDIYVICRRGIDSVTATRLLLAALPAPTNTDATQPSDTQISIKNIRGGMQAWTERIEPTFPLY